MQYIGFDIQETHYGIASDNIIEILQDGVITPLPCAPQGVCGMTIIREEVIQFLIYMIYWKYRLIHRLAV